MKEHLFLLRMAISLFPMSDIWLTSCTSYDCRVRLIWDKEYIRYLLSLGGVYSRTGECVTITFGDLCFTVDHRFLR